MLPPPGISPTLAQGPSPATTLLSSAIAAIGVALPSPISTVTATLDAAAAVASSKPSNPDNGECRLLGPFAIFVQGALGLLALLALVYKRYRERPQRPLKIWFFDVSKQVVGSVLVHIANLLMSMLSSGQLSIKVNPSLVEGRGISEIVRRVQSSDGKYQPNPCSFYLLNLAIDTTVGIPILILLLRVFTALFRLTSFGSPPESIASGNYDTPPRTWWWFKQSIIYFMGLMGMKICVLFIFLLAPWISRIGDWALRWTEGNEALQVIFVMLVFPVIMNAAQYYIIDSFIKDQTPGHELLPDGDEDEDDLYEDPSSGSSIDDALSDDEEDDPEVRAKAKVDSTKVASERRGNGSGNQSPKITDVDYDPQYDGENSPTARGGANTVDTDRSVMPSASRKDGIRGVGP